MLAPNVHSEYLPSINSHVETVRLAYGSFVRLCLHSAAFYGTRGYIQEKVFGKKGATDVAERDGICYVLSMAAEVGVSLLWMPVRYLAAVNTPRFLLDFLLTRWSERLSRIDGFRPGRFASYAVYAFTNLSADWNLDFFAWQIPSALLTIGKLVVRRRRVGAARCKTKRVLLTLLVQLILRAYLATFSVTLPETDSEAIESAVVVILEAMTTSYLVRNTWPFPVDYSSEASSSGTSTSPPSRNEPNPDGRKKKEKADSRQGSRGASGTTPYRSAHDLD